MKIEPDTGRRRPAMMLASVLFPEPFGPISPWIVPAATPTLTLLRTLGPVPYRNVMSRHSTIAADGAEVAEAALAGTIPGKRRARAPRSTAPSGGAASRSTGLAAPLEARLRCAPDRFKAPTKPSGTIVTTMIDRTPYKTC